MTITLTDIDDIEAWSEYLQGLVGFTGNTDIIEAFTWSTLSTMTVGDYLGLLDTVENQLLTFDWSFLAFQIPTIRQMLADQGLDQTQIDLAVGVLEDFIAGDLTLITEGFDLIRGFLSEYPTSALLIDVINGLVNPGGEGVVTIGDATDELLSGTDFDDKLKGAGGSDTIDALDGRDRIFGGSGDDDIDGGGGRDRIWGDGGNDKLKGGGGSDQIIGGRGADRISGGGGRDQIAGQEGRDVLFGGGGDDEFWFYADGGKDRVRDFELGSDKLYFFGATSLDDLTFRENASKGWTKVSFDGTAVIVDDVTEAELATTANFLGL